MAKKTETSKISVRAKQTPREFFTSWLLLFAMLVICVIFYIANPRVFSTGSVESMLATASMQGIVALGLMFVMTTGVFDLAAGMKSALAAAIVGSMMAEGFTMGGYILAIALGIAASVAFGVIHGVLTINLKIPGFIAALALRMILQAVVALLTKNTVFYSNDWGEQFKVIGQGSLFGIPYPFLIFVALCVICWFFYERTRTGRHIYATGANQTAAAQVGINTVKIKYISFIVGAILCAIGGILYTSRNFNVCVQQGLDIQMPAMTTVLLGAAFWEPGKYNVPGCFVGALFTVLLTTGTFSIFTGGLWVNALLQGLAFLIALGLISRTMDGGLSKVNFDM